MLKEAYRLGSRGNECQGELHMGSRSTQSNLKWLPQGGEPHVCMWAGQGHFTWRTTYLIEKLHSTIRGRLEDTVKKCSSRRIHFEGERLDGYKEYWVTGSHDLYVGTMSSAKCKALRVIPQTVYPRSFVDESTEENTCHTDNWLTCRGEHMSYG